MWNFSRANRDILKKRHTMEILYLQNIRFEGLIPWILTIEFFKKLFNKQKKESVNFKKDK